MPAGLPLVAVSGHYGRPPGGGRIADFLPSLFPGVFPEPAISISPHSTISPGMTATIWCRISQRAPDQDVVFALLEAESLEPLQRQSLAETSADFVLPSARAQEAGSYRCIYYTKKAPYRGSHLSRAQELTVLGQLPKPTLCAQPGLVASAGTKITFWCSRPKLSSLGKVTFTLWKNRTQKPLQQQVSAEPWTSFLVPLVRPEHTGSYSCTYRENMPSSRDSEPSDLLELVVPGSLPKPSLSALPSLVVEPGTHVTLQCRQPPKSPLWGVTFTLLKAGTPQPLQSQSPSGTSAVFPLLSVRAQDAGNYSCVYSSRTVLYQVSKPSEVLEIWVTDALPKPSLSAWPAPEVVSGASVTLVCQGATWKTRYVLHKERGEEILPSMDIAQEGAHFFLTRVTPKHSGNYSCSYQVSTNPSLWTKLSDPLELIVRASVPSNTLIITLSCISLLFCAFLLTFLCCRSIPMGKSGEEAEEIKKWFRPEVSTARFGTFPNVVSLPVSLLPGASLGNGPRR
uniref:Ig-like domain-containing protein n=1 Tax=Monodelphis domestica TaxID=13616 RepID=F7BGE4_MONDO